MVDHHAEGEGGTVPVPVWILHLDRTWNRTSDLDVEIHSFMRPDSGPVDPNGRAGPLTLWCRFHFCCRWKTTVPFWDVDITITRAVRRDSNQTSVDSISYISKNPAQPMLRSAAEQHLHQEPLLSKRTVIRIL
jgi:hypothetical protein